MAGLISVGYFLTTLLFSLVLFVLWMRIILRYFRVSSLHPIGKTVFSLTQSFIAPIEKLMYRGAHKLPRYDGITLAFIGIIELIKFTILGFLAYQTMISVDDLILLSIADMILQPCHLLFYALLIRVILSWVNPYWSQHPLGALLIMITKPLLQFGYKIVPNISGFDFSPFIVMIILKVITLFISASAPLPLL